MGITGAIVTIYDASIRLVISAHKIDGINHNDTITTLVMFLKFILSPKILKRINPITIHIKNGITIYSTSN